MEEGQTVSNVFYYYGTLLPDIFYQEIRRKVWGFGVNCQNTFALNMKKHLDGRERVENMLILFIQQSILDLS